MEMYRKMVERQLRTARQILESNPNLSPETRCYLKEHVIPEAENFLKVLEEQKRERNLQTE